VDVLIIEKAYAKINLALEVVKKRDDGYHDLKTIMIPLELHDILTFEPSEQTQVISNIDIQNNLVDKTVAYMKDKYHVDQHVKITIEKNIPIGAGLGGGSADVSATLRGLNQLWELRRTLKELEVDANILGSDTLFCLYNRPAYVYGRGEYIEFLENPDIKNIYLFNPELEISTKYVFSNYKIDKHHRNFDQLIALYKMKAYYKFFKNAYNDLHKTSISLYNNMKKYEKNVKKINKNAYMTGSGSTYFLVELYSDCKQIDKKLAKSKLKYIKTSPKN